MNGDGEMLEDKIHKFWFTTESGPERRLKKVACLREYINNMPITAKDFTLQSSSGPDKFGSGDILVDPMMYLVNTWVVPDWISPDRKKYYMNPNYVHASSFPNVYVRCECGVVVGKMESGRSKTSLVDQHNDDCCELYRLNARSVLMNRRKYEIEMGLKMGLEISDITVRVGLDSHYGICTDMYDIDIHELKNEYKTRASATYMYLVNRGVDVDLICDAYGHYRKTLGSRWGKEYLDAEYNRSTGKWCIPERVRSQSIEQVAGD